MTTFEWVMLRDVQRYATLATVGQVYIDGLVECVTLEDPVRELWDASLRKWIWRNTFKQPKATAIPSGRYKLVIDDSVRFQRLMPHLLAVPDFDGIRMHNGGTVEDTDGCPLLGRVVNESAGGLPYLSGSKMDAFPKFFSKLESALTMGEVWLTINNGEPA